MNGSMDEEERETLGQEEAPWGRGRRERDQG